MSKYKNRKQNGNSISQAKTEQYTNLMLITVLEAMVLLIGQLMIYNGYSVVKYTAAIRNVVMPVIMWVALVAGAALLTAYIIKKNKTVIKPLIFAAYVAVLMIVVRYVPNEIGQLTGAWINNTNKGMKIGAVMSALYVLVSFIVLYVKSVKQNRKK